MCAIIGALVLGVTTVEQVKHVNAILEHIWIMSHERGRDGRGFVVNSLSQAFDYQHRSTERSDGTASFPPKLDAPCRRAAIIGNLRAEPTTEFVADKKETDQQPYTVNGWSIVHNGTVANDKALRTGALPTCIDSAAIAEQLGLYAAASTNRVTNFVEVVNRIQGSYAILANHTEEPDVLYVAANYRPIWYAETELGVFFASARHYFPGGMVPQMVRPYTAMIFSGLTAPLTMQLDRLPSSGKKALVVCSGGLDSVVSATHAQRSLGYDIHLIHFLYGSRAEGPEVEAVKKVAEFLGAPLTLFPLKVYSKGDSPLLDPDSTVAGGEAGAEFAHEWVPARNLLLLSVATAFAEARGMETLVLGNNLEEAGAYPDNEPEFIARFNDLLPFAIGAGKRLEVIMPVGNMMKHEIVALGERVGAPMHLTWSCYRAGELHCGTCGPCYMRRKAFEINNIPEVISYKDEQ